MSASRLGLDDHEVDWLQSHMGRNKRADDLVRQYQMVVVCPRDPGARGAFAAMLEEARRDRVFTSDKSEG